VAFVVRVLFAALLVAVAGCAKTPQSSTNSTSAASTETSADIAEGDTDDAEAVAGVTVNLDVPSAQAQRIAAEETSANQPLLISANAPSADFANDYKISPRDVLDITVFRVPELSKVVPVSASGLISLPLIGEVSAAGRSSAELEAIITA
jgi:polysaccharide export outer membrane protein